MAKNTMQEIFDMEAAYRKQRRSFASLHKLRDDRSIEERLNACILKDGETGCWLSRTVKAEFKMSIGNGATKSLQFRRLSYYLHTGHNIEGVKLYNSCETTGCVNPEHLRPMRGLSDVKNDSHSDVEVTLPKQESIKTEAIEMNRREFVRGIRPWKVKRKRVPYTMSQLVKMFEKAIHDPKLKTKYIKERRSVKGRFYDKLLKAEGHWYWTATKRVSQKKPFKETPMTWLRVDSQNAVHIRAIHLSYYLHKGKIPAGFIVNQTCGEDLCVNPDHLCLELQTKYRHQHRIDSLECALQEIITFLGSTEEFLTSGRIDKVIVDKIVAHRTKLQNVLEEKK